MRPVSAVEARPGSVQRRQEESRSRSSVLDRVPVSLVAVAALAVLGTVKLILSLGQTFTSGGDVAFIELGIRQVLHGGVALGPYSRFGWHHPGPLYYYLDAPLYWLTGGRSRSLFLSAWLINMASALGSVAVVRRFAGERVARVAAGVLLVYVCAGGFLQLIEPWNPDVLALPVLLVLICTAACAAGSLWALVLELVAVSFVAQTHIGTVPICALAVAASVLCLVVTRRRATGQGRSLPAVVAAAAVVVVCWVAPLAQELSGHNGNLTQIARFYLHPPAVDGPLGHPLGDALAVVANWTTVVPGGLLTNGTAAAVDGHRGRLLMAGALTVIGLVGAVVGRRRAPFLAALCATTPIAFVVAVVAATRVIGPYDGYLFFWAEAIGLPALIGTIGLLATRTEARVGHRHATGGRRRTATGLLTTLGLIATLVIGVRVVARSGDNSYIDSGGARIAAARIEAAVGSRNRVFTVDVVTFNFSDGGTILTLVKDGYRFRVTPELDLYDGDTSAPATGPTFELQPSGPPAPPTLPGTHLVTAGLVDVWMHP